MILLQQHSVLVRDSIQHTRHGFISEDKITIDAYDKLPYVKCGSFL